MAAERRERGRLFGRESVAGSAADVIVLPIPFEGTVSYGKGTAAAPTVVLDATGGMETWDEELDFDLDSLAYHVDQPVFPAEGDTAGTFLVRLFGRAQQLAQHPGLLVGLGGEHSVTSSLVRGLCKARGIAFADLTVVQFDAQADLRSEFEGSRQSHACAMRPLVDLGVRLISIGVRSLQKEEYEYGKSTGRVETFFAQRLADRPEEGERLSSTLSGLSGPVYLTFDMDALEAHLCPGTGFPQPGGLGWWAVLRHLRTLLYHNSACELVGCDIVETVPMLGTKVNEFVAARLLAKVLAYRFGRERAAIAAR